MEDRSAQGQRFDSIAANATTDKTLGIITGVSLTCRFGSGEDERCCAASVDLVVTGVDVDAVHGEGLQVGDLHELGVHRALGERVLSLLQLRISDVTFRTRDVPARTLHQRAVGHSEHVSALSVRRSKGRENERYEDSQELLSCLLNLIHHLSS